MASKFTYIQNGTSDIFGQQINFKIPIPKTKNNIPEQKIKNLEKPFLVEMVKVNPNSISVFKENWNKQPKAKQQVINFSDTDLGEISSKKMPKTNKTNGFLSEKAGARLRNSIKVLFWLSGCYRKFGKSYRLSPGGKISFLTLDLSYTQQHDDNFIKKYMLSQFIIEISKLYPSILYIWRAEKQQNGNIHFHFLFNQFVPWQAARKIWNRLQEKEGYIEAYHDKFSNMDFQQYVKVRNKYEKVSIDSCKKAFKFGCDTDWRNPNSVDAQNLKKIENCYAYLSKYISKKDSTKKQIRNDSDSNLEIDTASIVADLSIDGRLYYSSSKISKFKSQPTHLSSDIITELNKLYDLYQDKFFSTDFYTLISIPAETLFALNCPNLFQLFVNAINPIDPTIFSNST